MYSLVIQNKSKVDDKYDTSSKIRSIYMEKRKFKIKDSSLKTPTSISTSRCWSRNQKIFSYNEQYSSTFPYDLVRNDENTVYREEHTRKSVKIGK